MKMYLIVQILYHINHFIVCVCANTIFFIVIPCLCKHECCLCLDNVDEDLLRNLTDEFSADF